MSKLYVVPTPIGNLDDITLRAVRVLSDVDLILAEDTRTTQVLLRHLGIEKRMWSHHKFNEHSAVEAVARTIESGEAVALVSDAGTPGISDPGFLLVRTCLEHGDRNRDPAGRYGFRAGACGQRLPVRSFLFRGFSAGQERADEALAATRRRRAYDDFLRVALPSDEDA